MGVDHNFIIFLTKEERLTTHRISGVLLDEAIKHHPVDLSMTEH
jgi:hypothetical protein